jgi:hypothetical protein
MSGHDDECRHLAGLCMSVQLRSNCGWTNFSSAVFELGFVRRITMLSGHDDECRELAGLWCTSVHTALRLCSNWALSEQPPLTSGRSGTMNSSVT